MSYDDRLGDYNDVASRMREFFEKYPDGRLRPASQWRIETIADKQFVVYEAAAYRGAEDTLPGIGTAWEPFPGRTPYTRDSELMNAETSAWGRAILAVGAADTKKGIASAEEVRNRRADQEQWDNATPAEKPPTDAQTAAYDALTIELDGVTDRAGIPAVGKKCRQALSAGEITRFQFNALDARAGDRIAALRREETEKAPIDPDQEGNA